MKLVIGGAYQGKLAYAKMQYQFADGWIDGSDCPMEAILNCRGIDHFHEYVKRMIGQTNEPTDSSNTMQNSMFRFRTDHLEEMEQQAETFVKWLYTQNPELVIVSTELGCGVVPIERKDRLWREAVGRICTSIAAQADEVVRVACGIGINLKKSEAKRCR